MIDIPLGKAVAPVEARKGYDCRDCIFYGDDGDDCLKCGGKHRKDGKEVVYILVDYPKEKKKWERKRNI